MHVELALVGEQYVAANHDHAAAAALHRLHIGVKTRPPCVDARIRVDDAVGTSVVVIYTSDSYLTTPAAALKIDCCGATVMLSQLLKPPSQQCRCVYIYRSLTANASVAENHHHPTSASTVILYVAGAKERVGGQ